MAGTALRVAVVGVGHVGRHHARILAELPGVELVAVADIDAGRAAEAAAANGCQSVHAPDALPGGLDAVTVAVPTEAHRRVAQPLLERGIPVLVEKPVAASLRDADALVAAAARGGALLAVGHTERYNPAVAVARRLIAAPRFIEVHRLAQFPGRGLDVDVVFDLMIHDLDLLLDLGGASPTAIEAVGVPVLSERVDIANARIRFDNGCIANLTASRISRERVRKLRFFQKDALVAVDCAAQQVDAWRVVRRAGAAPAIEGGALEVPPGEPLALELADFVAAVRSGERPAVDGVAGRRALALAQQVADAMQSSGAATS